jgi:hypothetical protein
MTDQPPSPREAVRQALDTVTGYGTKPSTDLFVEALRSRGYVVVPREPTDEMVAAYESGVGLKTTREWWRAMIDAANPGGGGKG